VAPAVFAAPATAAIARGDDAVVAAGGDGTVSTVAGALAGTDTAFGVLPLGTLNHFARDVGVPSDFEQAVRVIAAGRVRVVDVGEVNGHAFVNNSSIGLYPQMVRRRDAQQQRLGRGKWSAMLFAAIAVFRRFPLLSVRIRGDDVAVAMRAPFVFVGNNAYQMDLLDLGERTRLDDGALYVYAPRCTTRLGLVWLMVMALFNRLDQAEDFITRRVEELSIETRRRALHVSVDGEVIELPGTLHYTARAGALRVLTPAAGGSP
jgi:diacylglycerol kinase family enzyme